MIKQKLVSKELDSALGDYSNIRMAHLIERDFAEYYDKSDKENDGEIRILFQMLVDWGEGHVAIMKEKM